MDYETKPTSRNDLRRYSIYFRKLFDVPETGPFPVLEALDKVNDVFEDCGYVIVEDKKLSPQTMAQCVPNERGGFTIEIKNSVYQCAYDHNVGALRGFICHEICHIFLFKIGFTPIYARSFADHELAPYRSVEWQAKALCAEVMIPFEETIGMMPKMLVEKYQVSKAFAKARRKLDDKNRKK